MLQVSPSFDFSSFSPVESQKASSSDGCQRLRSSSLFETSDLIECQKNFLRPRSRSFYTFDQNENNEDQQAFQADAGKEDTRGNIRIKPSSKRSTAGLNKHLSKDHGGKFLSQCPSQKSLIYHTEGNVVLRVPNFCSHQRIKTQFKYLRLLLLFMWKMTEVSHSSSPVLSRRSFRTLISDSEMLKVVTRCSREHEFEY